MKIPLTLSCALVAICLTGSLALAGEPLHTKIVPHSLGYPLISPAPYKRNPTDPYARSFAVRRIFRGVRKADHEVALVERRLWDQNYGGYGVLGHGEDVFTREAARFRSQHQGK